MAEDDTMCNGDGRDRRWAADGRTSGAREQVPGALLLKSSLAVGSARTLDGDEFVARGASVGRRDGARDLVAVDFSERRRLDVVARLAIGGRDRDAAGRAGRQ